MSRLVCLYWKCLLEQFGLLWLGFLRLDTLRIGGLAVAVCFVLGWVVFCCLSCCFVICVFMIFCVRFGNVGLMISGRGGLRCLTCLWGYSRFEVVRIIYI